MSAAKIWVPWKSCDVFFDFTCSCGARGDAEGYFVYNIHCPACGKVWTVPQTIALVEKPDGVEDDPLTQTADLSGSQPKVAL